MDLIFSESRFRADVIKMGLITCRQKKFIAAENLRILSAEAYCTSLDNNNLTSTDFTVICKGKALTHQTLIFFYKFVSYHEKWLN